MSDVLNDLNTLRERMRAEYDETIKRAKELRAALAMMGEQFTTAYSSAMMSTKSAKAAPGGGRRSNMFGESCSRMTVSLRVLSQVETATTRTVAVAMYGSSDRSRQASASDSLRECVRRGLAREVAREKVRGTITRCVYAITDAGREYLATHGSE